MDIHMKELSVEGLNLYSHDVDNYNGRGVAIYVRNEIVSVSVNNTSYCKSYKGSNGLLLHLGVYKSLSLEKLKNILLYDKKQCIKFSLRLIMGDFKYEEINWEIETTSVNYNHPATLFRKL